ncbi:hypothetical protein C8J57DRAFT_1249916 [Mycena rebaudengoi]|nr:hypothetical protein C8J57DRAFT_1249916 [Mycena rebaudengoi]
MSAFVAMHQDVWSRYSGGSGSYPMKDRSSDFLPRLTAPTGVVARTIHSEASLRVPPAKMKSASNLRTNREERIAHLETLILDEVYFLNANDLARLSEYLCMGKGITDEDVKGIQVWHQVKHVVVLEEIMWQNNPALIHILKQLRKDELALNYELSIDSLASRFGSSRRPLFVDAGQVFGQTMEGACAKIKKLGRTFVAFWSHVIRVNR